MKNEIEVCKLVNECAIMKRELEQKEKTIEDLQKDVKNKSDTNETLQIKLNQKIEGKQQVLRKMR
jgi:peptidoglycan hydrolase CwlO-like protein